MKQKLLKTMLLLCALVVGTSSVWAADYVKITAVGDLTDGQYLIVCANQGVAFNGGLETLDASSNTIAVTISDNKIAVNGTTTAAEFTIAAITGGYSIKSASGKFIGRTSNSNGFNTGATAFTHTITFSDGNANITSSAGPNLRYNKTSGQERFRYFTTAQTAIQLFKKVDSRTPVATINNITPTTINWKTIDEFTLDATYATGLTASDYTISWESSDDTKLELADETYESKNKTGNVTVTVTITPKDAETYKEVSKDFTVTIVDPRLVVNMTGFTATTTTLYADETTATTVTNDQPGWAAAYTYESDNEDIATVNASGEISAISVGTATITATLNVSSEDTNYKAGSTKSQSILITVTDKAIYTATFMVNGSQLSTETAPEDETFDFPVAPALIGGLSFAGWSKTELAPTLVNTDTEAMSNNTTYYAVYGKVTSTVDDELTTTTFGSPSSYTEWSGKSVHTAVYAGQSSGGTNYIQLRSTDPSGIVSTKSGGKIVRVAVVWNNSTVSGRTLDVYGKNSAYSGSTILYGDGAGTLLGSIVKGTSTVLNIGGGYDYVGLRSNNGAMYFDKITITWGIFDEETYTTTISPVDVSVTSVGYATFASDLALDFTDKAVTAYIAKANGTSGVTFHQVNKVPAGTGVLLYKDGGTGETPISIPALVGDETDDVTGNVFVRGTGAAVTSVDGYLHNYVLNKPAADKPVGFYKAAGLTVATNRAYIQIDESTPVKGFIALPGSDETAVEAVKAEAENGVIFNLAGQRVSKLQRGINIINGRKVVVK